MSKFGCTTPHTNATMDEIYRSGNDMEEVVVRWCRRCGAVVIDIDSDGRTKPGAIMPMQFREEQ